MILHVISDGFPIMDELCKRIIKFTHSCVVSEYAMLYRLARFTLSVRRMISILGMNASFFSIRCRLDTFDVEREYIYMSCLRIFYELPVSIELRLTVHLIREAIMERDGFELHEINAVMNYLVAHKCIFIILCLIQLFMFSGRLAVLCGDTVLLRF